MAAFEYRRIQGLAADPPPGLKLLLVEPWVRRGILLLSSENTTVLGGEVREVETGNAWGQVCSRHGLVVVGPGFVWNVEHRQGDRPGSSLWGLRRKISIVGRHHVPCF